MCVASKFRPVGVETNTDVELQLPLLSDPERIYQFLCILRHILGWLSGRASVAGAGSRANPDRTNYFQMLLQVILMVLK